MKIAVYNQSALNLLDEKFPSPLTQMFCFEIFPRSLRFMHFSTQKQ
jgi:hypothetical protein